MKPLIPIIFLTLLVIVGIGLVFFVPFTNKQTETIITTLPSAPENLPSIIRTLDTPPPTIAQTSELIDVIQRGFGAVTTMLGIPLLLKQLKTEKKRRAAVRANKPASEVKKRRQRKKETAQS